MKSALIRPRQETKIEAFYYISGALGVSYIYIYIYVLQYLLRGLKHMNMIYFGPCGAPVQEGLRSEADLGCFLPQSRNLRSKRALPIPRHALNSSDHIMCASCELRSLI